MTFNELQAELEEAQAHAMEWEGKVREIKKKIEAFIGERRAKGLKPRDCCNVQDNLLELTKPRKIAGRMGDGTPITGVVTVRQCKVCAAQHTEVAPEPGRLGLASK